MYQSSVLTGIFVFLFMGSSVFAQSNDITSRQILGQIKKGTLVVRIPTQGKKIAYLKSSLTKLPRGGKAYAQTSMSLEEAILEDRQLFESVATAFERRFSFTKVCYVPDSLFGAFMDGKSSVFVRPGLAFPEEKNITGDIFLWLPLENRIQFGLYNKKGESLPPPLPFKKNTFLPAFKRWLIPGKYIENQVRWLQKKLEEMDIKG